MELETYSAGVRRAAPPVSGDEVSQLQVALYKGTSLCMLALQICLLPARRP